MNTLRNIVDRHPKKSAAVLGAIAASSFVNGVHVIGENTGLFRDQKPKVHYVDSPPLVLELKPTLVTPSVLGKMPQALKAIESAESNDHIPKQDLNVFPAGVVPDQLKIVDSEGHDLTLVASELRPEDMTPKPGGDLTGLGSSAEK